MSTRYTPLAELEALNPDLFDIISSERLKDEERLERLRTGEAEEGEGEAEEKEKSQGFGCQVIATVMDALENQPLLRKTRSPR